MAGQATDPLAGLATILGHRFRRRDLLVEALTHASLTEGGTSYQRLEFLGDRVLGLAIADMLVDTFPAEAEGDLARRYTALVRAETLTRVAEQVGLGSYLRLPVGGAGALVRDSAGILADAMEAVIAALYLDGGLDVAVRFVEAQWRPLLAAMPEPPEDAKTALQEWAQGHGLPLPRYVEVDRCGPDHEPQFTIEVRLADLPPARAEGRSKRVAEQAAAALLLQTLYDGDG